MLNNYIQTKIQTIKDKKLFGSFVEVGAGLPVYNELCQHPNTASKIVLCASSPNNWEYNKWYHDIPNDVRAISPEVLHLFNNEVLLNNVDGPICNFTLTNTIQIANEPSVQTHGWFGLQFEDVTKYYHFTINDFMPRPELLKMISAIGLDILASANNINELDNGYIDKVINEDFTLNDEDTLTCILDGKLNLENKNNTTTIFTKDGNIIRLADYLRNSKENLIVFKGSFNPIHPHHLELINKVTTIIDNNDSIFCISINNRDAKKKVDSKSLLKRINLINHLGFDVIIDCLGYYNDSYNTITNNPSFKHKLNYIMGGDICQRFIDDEKQEFDKPWNYDNKDLSNDFNNKWEHCCFVYANRAGIDNIKIDKFMSNKFIEVSIDNTELSSTQIRNLIDEDNFEELSKLVDNELLELYKEWKKN